MSLTVARSYKLDELPSEIRIRILRNLDPKDLARIALVSKKMLEVAYSNFVWKRIYRMELGNFPSSPSVSYRDVVLQSWRESARVLVPKPLGDQKSLVAQRELYKEEIDKERDVENSDPEIAALIKNETVASKLLKSRVSEPAVAHVIHQGAVLSGESSVKSSFDIAIEENYPISTLRLLVANGASPSPYKSPQKLSSVDYALQANCSDEVLTYLLDELQAPLTQAEPGRQSSLDRAVEAKRPQSIIQSILNRGIRLTRESTRDVKSTLDLAIISKNPMGTIELLFQKGARATLSTRDVSSTFEHAIIANYPFEDLTRLYELGADFRPIPGFYNPDNGEMLFHAIRNKMSEEAILWLLEIGLGFNRNSAPPSSIVPLFYKYSSLDYALKQGYGIRVIEALHRKGIAISSEDFSVRCAEEGNCSQEVLDFLERPSKRLKEM